MTEYSSVSTLYGRSALLGEIVGSEAPVTILVGNSGIGKTELLVHAQRATEFSLAPPPVEVFSRQGALVEAVADSLASALAQVVGDPDGATQLRRVQEFVVELGKRAGGFVAQVVKEAFLQQLRLHLGDRAFELGSELAEALKNGSYETLGSRIGDIRNSDVISELVSIATDLRELSGCSQLSLALDRLEILPEDDVRLLVDLARLLPSGVVLKAALLDTTTKGFDTLQLLEDLADNGIATISIGPLDEPAIREYLKAADLDPALAPEVMQQTGGYPLHVGDLVRHLTTGGHLAEIAINAKFGRMIQPRWDALTPETRQVARQLCLTERPLPLDIILTSLGVQDSAWWDMVETLRTERIFSQIVGGMPWFHEQRRRWLVDQISQEEKRATALRMLPAVCKVAISPSGWSYCTTLAQLVRYADDSISDKSLEQVAALNDAELSLAGAALELGASHARPADAAMLLAHARGAFRAEGDLVVALDSMVDKRLLNVQGFPEAQATAIHGTFDRLEEVAIGGLCQERLGRLPVRDLAWVLWETSLGRNAPSPHLAVCGVGWIHAGDEIEQVHIAKMRSNQTIGRFYGCLVVGDLQGVPVYAVASATADEVPALKAAWSGATGEIGGCTLKVRAVVPVPSERMRGKRWSVAANDLLERQGSLASDSIPDLSLEAEMQITASASQTMRLGSSPTERLVGGLDEQQHIYFWGDESEATKVHALGQTAGSTRISPPRHWSMGDQMVRLRLADQISLPLNCRVGKIVSGFRRLDQHPLKAVASEVDKDTQSFNKHRQRIEVDVREGQLEAWLGRVMDLRQQDAERLFEGVDAEGLVAPSHYEVFLLASESPKSPIPGIYAIAAIRPSSRSIVHYRLRGSSSAGSNRIALNEIFPDSVGWPIFSSTLARVIADLSGYADDDLVVRQHSA
jgi:hypothetical protein